MLGLGSASLVQGFEPASTMLVQGSEVQVGSCSRTQPPDPSGDLPLGFGICFPGREGAVLPQLPCIGSHLVLF